MPTSSMLKALIYRCVVQGDSRAAMAPFLAHRRAMTCVCEHVRVTCLHRAASRPGRLRTLHKTMEMRVNFHALHSRLDKLLPYFPIRTATCFTCTLLTCHLQLQSGTP